MSGEETAPPSNIAALGRWRWLGRWHEGAAGIDGRAAGAAAVFTPAQRAGLLAGFVLLVILRLPHAWLQGRFLGEEGNIFFAYAWHRAAPDALFRSFGGYLNIAANAITLLAARLVQAGILPLERAPHLTMALALPFQMLPAILILTGRARWLANRWAVLAALLTLAASPRTEEVFANVLHIQFHLALCAAMILVLDVPHSRAARAGYAVILWLAPLCGPGAILLAPLFLLRTLVDRDRARLWQSLALGVGIALQMLVFFTPSPVRGHFLHPVALAGVLLVRFVVTPLLWPSKGYRYGELIYASFHAGGAGWWIAAAIAALCFGLLIAVALRDREDGAIWLIAAALIVAAVSFGGGMIISDPRDWFSVGAGERYNFLPMVLLGFVLIMFAMRPRRRDRPLWVLLCLMTAVTQIRMYPKPLAELSTGPVWAKEVARWRRDHDYALVGWPDSWTVDLSDRARPCPTPRPRRSAAADPGYCESAWAARVGLRRVADPAPPLP